MTRKRLTKMQRAYLEDIILKGRLHQGWGGRSSTQTVRYLEQYGLIHLQRWPRSGGRADTWEATPLVREVPEVLERVGGRWRAA